MPTLLAAILANVVAAALAWRARALDVGGLLAGFVLGTVVWATAGWAAWVLLAFFVVVGASLTKFGLKKKESLGAAQDKGGKRGIAEVVANGLVAGLAAIWLGLDGGVAARFAFTGALATALADTTASELGPLYGRRCVLASNWRRVPPGTEGAISLEGTFAGLAAAFLLTALAVATGFAPSIALIVVPVAAATASWLESLLGAIVKRGILADNAIQNVSANLVGAVWAVVIGNLVS